MKILISGAGIAGLTLAYWLEKQGHDIDLIDKRSEDQHEKGYIIYFWGAGREVADRMGILPAIQLLNQDVSQLNYMKPNGKLSASVSVKSLGVMMAHKVSILLRGDLLYCLSQSIKTTVQYNHDIVAITQTATNVQVTFSNETQTHYDLVVGADGVHSRVRSLVFGEESQFIHALGYTFGVFIQPKNHMLAPAFHAYAMPDKKVAVFPISTNSQAAFFIYKNKHIDGATASFTQVFQRAGWIVPDLLQDISASSEKYIDTLIQVSMPQWYRGRVVLIGDACQCLSLTSGLGASMAMTGAYVLAHAVKQNGDKLELAFAQYQAWMKPHIEIKQKAAKRFLRTFLPATRLGIFIRNKLAKYIHLPIISAFIFKGLLKQRMPLPALYD